MGIAEKYKDERKNHPPSQKSCAKPFGETTAFCTTVQQKADEQAIPRRGDHQRAVGSQLTLGSSLGV